jgi:hypothetical protein
MKLPADSALTHVERQRRYRASRDLLSIDVRRKTVEAISALRLRTGMTTDAVIAAAAATLAAKLDKTVLSGRPTTKPGRQSQVGNQPNAQGESPGNQTPCGMGNGHSAESITGRICSDRADSQPVAQPNSFPSGKAGGSADTLPPQGDLFGDSILTD